MSNTIQLTIRLSNDDKVSVEADQQGTILELKEKINQVLAVPPAQQRLIYKGKVLKDECTLDFYKIENEHTVHMVKGSSPNAANPSIAAPAATPSAPVASPPQLRMPNTPIGGTDPLMNLVMNNPNLMNNPQAMQEQLMQNPEMLSSLMNSPMMEGMLSNPDLMRNMMMNNPQMQAMMDANPQMRHVLNDPSVNIFVIHYLCSLL